MEDIYTEGRMHFIRGVCIELLVEENIANGDMPEDVLKSYPGLTISEVKQAIDYAEKHLPNSCELWKKEIREFKTKLAFHGQRQWP